MDAVSWEPLREPAPAEALAGRDAVVHLAGEPVAQRWSARAKRAIRDSRVIGTRNLVAGLTQVHRSETGEPPRTLISSSAIGYYGAHGEEPLDEDAPPGDDFLAGVCVEWEAAAAGARELGVRVGARAHGRGARPRRRRAREDAAAVPARRRRSGGRRLSVHLLDPRGGRRRDDARGARGRALERARSTPPRPSRSPTASSRRCSAGCSDVPSLLPVPGSRCAPLYGEMAEIVTTGARVMPAKALVLGYEFAYPQLERAALRAHERLAHRAACTPRPAHEARRAPTLRPVPARRPGAAPGRSPSR